MLYLTKGRVYDFARSDDAFMMGLEFLTAEKDAAVIRERQLRTVRLHAQQGRPHGQLPFGYRRVYDEHTGVLLLQEIDPEKATIITNAVYEILSGTTVNAIVTRLNRAGVPTPMKPASDHSRGWMSSRCGRSSRAPPSPDCGSTRERSSARRTGRRSSPARTDAPATTMC